jgi:hypothetical protein
MNIFRGFEREVILALIGGSVGAEEARNILDSSTLVSLEHTGAGYFLRARHSALPIEQAVCYEPTLIGRYGDDELQFVLFLGNRELTLDCNAASGATLPTDIRDHRIAIIQSADKTPGPETVRQTEGVPPPVEPVEVPIPPWSWLAAFYRFNPPIAKMLHVSVAGALGWCAISLGLMALYAIFANPPPENSTGVIAISLIGAVLLAWPTVLLVRQKSRIEASNEPDIRRNIPAADAEYGLPPWKWLRALHRFNRPIANIVIYLGVAMLLWGAVSGFKFVLYGLFGESPPENRANTIAALLFLAGVLLILTLWFIRKVREETEDAQQDIANDASGLAVAHPLRRLLDEWLPDIDFGVMAHGFREHGRDYVLCIEVSKADVRPGQYELVFTHVVSFNYQTRVPAETWSESWDDRFTDFDSWEESGQPEGYVWGTNWSLANPGIAAIDDSQEASNWAAETGKQFFEAVLETDRFAMALVFHDIRVNKISDDAEIVSQVIIPLEPT